MFVTLEMLDGDGPISFSIDHIRRVHDRRGVTMVYTDRDIFEARGTVDEVLDKISLSLHEHEKNMERAHIAARADW